MDIKQILDLAVKKEGNLSKVAKKLNVSYQTAHRWKTGESTPNGKNLMQLIDLIQKAAILLAVGTFCILCQIPRISGVSPLRGAGLLRVR